MYFGYNPSKDCGLNSQGIQDLTQSDQRAYSHLREGNQDYIYTILDTGMISVCVTAAYWSDFHMSKSTRMVT